MPGLAGAKKARHVNPLVTHTVAALKGLNKIQYILIPRCGSERVRGGSPAHSPAQCRISYPKLASNDRISLEAFSIIAIRIVRGFQMPWHSGGRTRLAFFLHARDRYYVSVYSRRSSNVGWMLGQRLRRWPNIEPTRQRPVLAGYYKLKDISSSYSVKGL